jgi:hypothetical protein
MSSIGDFTTGNRRKPPVLLYVGVAAVDVAVAAPVTALGLDVTLLEVAAVEKSLVSCCWFVRIRFKL